MNYFVIASDGQKFGPADLATLNQWAQEGRVLTTTMLEDASTGQQIPATQLAGLVFPVQPPSPGPGPAGYQPYAPMATDDGSEDIKKVWIFGTIGFFCCPIIFSVMAIIYATNAQKKGHPQGQTALIFAIISLVVGFGLSIGVRAGMASLNR